MLKKILSIVLLCACFLQSCSVVALAEDLPFWVRITKDGVALHPSPSESKTTCLLEKSYYVHAVSQTGEYFRVELFGESDEFTKIVGFVKKDDVETCDETPLAPHYPTVQLTFKSTAKLHFSPLEESETLFAPLSGQTANYYGKVFSEGKTWLLVNCFDEFGYVEITAVEDFAVPLHPTPLAKPADQPEPEPQEQTPQPQTPQETPSQGTQAEEILMIVFVVVLAVCLVAALFLPNREKRRNAQTESYK